MPIKWFDSDRFVRMVANLFHRAFHFQTNRSNGLAAIVFLGSCLLNAVVVRAETHDNQLPSELSDMGVTEHLADTIPLDLEFQDENGRTVRLGQYFKPGRPVILSFNYSNCPMLCSLQLSGLVTGLKEVELNCERDYQLISISIDPHEQPMRAAQTRQRYYQMYGREGTGGGWHFLVGSEQAIKVVTAAVGMTYRYLPERKEYLHPAVCVILTADGRLSRYLYGVEFAPQTVRLALVEASAGQIGTTLDQILLFCFHYDGMTGRYALAARRLMTSAGAFTALILGGFLFRQFRRESTSRTSPQPQAIELGGTLLDPVLNQRQLEFAARTAAIRTTADVAASDTH